VPESIDYPFHLMPVKVSVLRRSACRYFVQIMARKQATFRRNKMAKKTTLNQDERNILRSAKSRLTIARDMNSDYQAEGGLGGRLADNITLWAGSWTFILLFLGFLGVWALINTEVLGSGAFDPYPFIFLNLILSMLAAIQAPVILMAANRQAARDRIDARHDYEVNLKAELEIMALHDRIEDLRTSEIEEIKATLAKLVAALEQKSSKS
jgi:uncharacterized membrane protein